MGVKFSLDGRFVVHLSDKRSVADLQYNHTLTKDSFSVYIQSKGYSYDPESKLLSKDAGYNEEETLNIISSFLKDSKEIDELNKKM